MQGASGVRGEVQSILAPPPAPLRGEHNEGDAAAGRPERRPSGAISWPKDLDPARGATICCGPVLKSWLRRWLEVPADVAPPPSESDLEVEKAIAFGQLEARMESLEARWRNWKTEADTFLEAVDQALDQVEHKRRQVTSAAARAARRAETAEDATSAPPADPADVLAAMDPNAARAAILRLVRARRRAG